MPYEIIATVFKGHETNEIRLPIAYQIILLLHHLLLCKMNRLHYRGPPLRHMLQKELRVTMHACSRLGESSGVATPGLKPGQLDSLARATAVWSPKQPKTNYMLLIILFALTSPLAPI